MKEESKYYTPTIEEFHVGFEYEWLNTESAWVKADTPTEITVEGFEEQTYGLRVKALDREDIESLGFIYKFEEEGEDGFLFFEGSFNNRIYELNIPNSFKLDRDDYRTCIDVKVFNGSNTLFIGTIKNKSELKRLLKQLRI